VTISQNPPASTVCPHCGADNAAAARFCSTCGNRLDGGTPPSEERKLVSILFVDLVGFTSISEQADPEDVRDALRLYHAAAKRHVEEHGGVLEKFIGDAVMAVFGAPVAHGDDAERAVRAGLAVLESLGGLNRANGLELAARAAVNTGEAVVAVSAERTGEALATGDVVNTAARLQSAAPTGRLIVGAETYRATRHAIRYDELDAVEAKGKAEPVRAWIAVEASLAPAERPIATNSLVGRSRELDLIHSLWDRAITERRPQLVTLLGPPGIGKSRLCHEVANVVAGAGGRIVRGRCLPYGEQTGYQAFAHLVRGAAGILDTDAPDPAREKLDRLVADVVPALEADEVRRHLAVLLGIGGDEDVDRQRLLFYSARRFVEHMGLAVPTLLVFEDIHWAQTSELDLLEYLAKHVSDTAVLVVALARPDLLDERPAWGSGLVAQITIPLEPLAAADAARLVSDSIGAGSSFDVARLVEIAEGNPLFLEELAASVVEGGDTAALPVTVREAIASRIDAMPAEARAVLLSAAVVGRIFWRGVVAAVGVDDDIDDALSLLEARDLIRRMPTSELEGDTEFAFRHMLIREVAYGTLPRATRRERHARVAQYVEDLVAGATQTLSSILAHHWREAGEPRRAVPYLLAAAEAARRSWAEESVIELYSTAFELADTDELRRDIRLRRGHALVQLANYEGAADELGAVLPELEGRERLDALIAHGHATLWSEREADTLEAAEEAAALAEELGDESFLPAVLSVQSHALAMRGADGDMARALELGDRALELWEPGTRTFDLMQHLHLQSDATYWAGQYERAVQLSRETRAAASDVQSVWALLRGGGFEALSLCGLGRHEEAITIWDEMFALARELDQSPLVLLNYSALAYRELYDVEEARTRSEQALELAAGLTFSMPEQFAGSDLVFTQLLSGDVGGAQTTWPKRWAAAEHATAWTTWLIAGRLQTARAEIALHAEDAETAAKWARRAIETTRRTKRRKYEARALTLLGRALARLGRREDALEALHAAVEIADALVGPPARWDARVALGEAAYSLGDDDTAATAYEEAASLIESFAPTLATERAARLLAAPAIEEALSLAGRKPVA
jgi:class 3 adenylate cyclase/tetratricopeptide (TPR) repeat protein